MGYLYAIAAVLSAAIKGFCGKRTSDLTDTPEKASGFSAIRALLCVPCALAAVLIATGGLSALSMPLELLPICAVGGAAWGFLTVSWLFAVRGGAFMLVAAVEGVGVFIPVLLSALFFPETESLGIWKVVGLIIMIAAAIVMNSYSKQLKGKTSPLTWLAAIISSLCNAINEFSQKWFNRASGGGTDSSVYVFYTYVFALLVVLIFFAISKSVQPKSVSPNKPPKGRLVLFAFLMAICTLFYTLSSTAAAGLLPSSVLFPLKQGLAMIVNVAMSAIFFKERVKPSEIVGVALAFCAMILINLF